MNKKAKENSANLEIFKRNFNRYLKASGKKQVEVARYVDVSNSTISDWKAGRAYPRIDKVQLLAECFSIKKSDLVEDVNVAKETITNKEQEFFDLFHKIPEEKRELVLSMIRAAIENL